tara:strand:- start:1569 stop:2570 length:1002 start_codon:yes stop_codon:yes gene_type:complete
VHAKFDFEHICYHENIKKYQCILCDYFSSEKSNMKKHINTKKHKSACSKTSQKLLFGQKNYFLGDSFFCKLCDYSTSKACNFNRHLQSQKHCSFLTRFLPKNEQKTTCDDSMITKESGYLLDGNNKVERLENLVEKLVDQNNKLTNSIQDTMETQSKVIYEIAKQPKIIQNNNNNSFNVMNYLNNDCKDALNLTEFINTLKIDYNDLLKIRDNGYVYGMERSIIDNLIALEKTKRPIQCTDAKRKKFFIKDKEKWDIDPENERINKVLCDVTTKHIYELQQWKLRNPDWMDNDRKFDIITDITCQILKGSSENGEKLKKKVFEKLCKAVKINK